MQICAVRSKTARRNRILRNAAAVAIAGTFAGTQADAAVTYTLMLQGGTTWSDSVWMPLDQPVIEIALFHLRQDLGRPAPARRAFRSIGRPAVGQRAIDIVAIVHRQANLS